MHILLNFVEKTNRDIFLTFLAVFVGFGLSLLGQWAIKLISNKSEKKKILKLLVEELERIEQELEDENLDEPERYEAYLNPLNTNIWKIIISQNKIYLLKSTKWLNDIIKIYGIIEQYNEVHNSLFHQFSNFLSLDFYFQMSVNKTLSGHDFFVYLRGSKFVKECIYLRKSEGEYQSIRTNRNDTKNISIKKLCDNIRKKIKYKVKEKTSI